MHSRGTLAGRTTRPDLRAAVPTLSEGSNAINGLVCVRSRRACSLTWVWLSTLFQALRKKSDLPPKNSRRGFLQLLIGSHPALTPSRQHNCTRLQSLRLRNGVGSPLFHKPRPHRGSRRPQPLRVLRKRWNQPMRCPWQQLAEQAVGSDVPFTRKAHRAELGSRAAVRRNRRDNRCIHLHRHRSISILVRGYYDRGPYHRSRHCCRADWHCDRNGKWGRNIGRGCVIGGIKSHHGLDDRGDRRRCRGWVLRERIQCRIGRQEFRPIFACRFNRRSLGRTRWRNWRIFWSSATAVQL